MQSFIITSKNRKTAFEFAVKLCADNNISSIDTKIISLDLESDNPKNSIGIEEVRNIQATLFLKPIQSSQKAIIITDASRLTHQAQNALLKILEEPPANTLIFLTLETKDTLLPTICSRCKIIELQNQDNAYKKEELDNFSKTIDSLLSGTVTEKLKLAQDITKNKEDTVMWLEKGILSLREKLLENPTSTLSLRQFQNAHTLLTTTNANPRLIVENLLLNV